MKRVLSIFGTRPEAIKMAPVVRALEEVEAFESVVCTTGQHQEMLQQVLDLFGIQPNISLNVMTHNSQLGTLTASILESLQTALDEIQPDLILVHGDTTTTMAAALSGYYAKVPVAHVEAGLRTFDNYAPWPEEVNRKIVASIAKVHFPPTEQAKKNLLLEAVHENAIFVHGNTVVDALLQVVSMISANPELQECYRSQFKLDDAKKLILVTGHRRENFGEGFENICNALVQLSQRDDLQIIYPVHLNPNVKEPVTRALRGASNVSLVPPLSYQPFVYLMQRADVILTDSGGIQEEAAALGKPVVIMRAMTERPEVLNSSRSVLVGTDPSAITSTVLDFVDGHAECGIDEEYLALYGGGEAARNIVRTLEGLLLESPD